MDEYFNQSQFFEVGSYGWIVKEVTKATSVYSPLKHAVDHSAIMI